MLKILKNGAIQGGEVSWEYKDDVKAVHYWGNVKLKFGPFKKTVNFDDHYHIEREKLLSVNVVSGAVIELEDGGKLEVVSVTEDRATCEVDGPSYHGTIELDITGDLIDVTRLNVKVNASGIKATLRAERV